MTKPTLSLKNNAAEEATPLILTTEEALAQEPSLSEVVRQLREELAEVKASQAKTAAKVDETYDLTNDKVFIRRPGYRKWSERRIVNNKAVEVEFAASEFLGPFESQEQAEGYVSFKARQREDAFLNWTNVQYLSGREARQIKAAEDAEREMDYGDSGPVNILDRRIFAARANHTPGLGQVIGQG